MSKKGANERLGRDSGENAGEDSGGRFPALVRPNGVRQRLRRSTDGVGAERALGGHRGGFAFQKNQVRNQAQDGVGENKTQKYL
jgi:hypothetical protein